MLVRLLSGFCLLICFNGASFSQAVRSESSLNKSDVLTAAFEEWRINGFVGGAIKTLPGEKVRLDVKTGTGEIRRFQSDPILTVRGELNISGEVKGNPIGVMREIGRKLRQICDEASGVLRHANLDTKNYDFETLNRIKQIGIREKLIGGNTCVKEDKPVFHFELFAPVRTSTSFTGITTFELNLTQVSAELIASADEEIKAFRSKLVAGSEIAMHLDDIPQVSRPKAGSQSTPALPNYRLCGLLVELKPGLAQVQIGGGVFFAKDTLLFPPGKVMDAKTGYPVGATAEWCWK
jgi:hypothetical protein